MVLVFGQRNIFLTLDVHFFISILTFTILTSVGPNDEKKEQQHDVSPWTTFLKVKGCFTLDMRGNNGFSFDKCISSLTLRWGVREDYCHYFGLICILRKEVSIISQREEKTALFLSLYRNIQIPKWFPNKTGLARYELIK